ncbi:hypothetical protein ACJMK2_004952 [Sinanodonta woodiana]|uniref:Homeobox domain-containing protein n=1 Tax=Sinanodonta woodiana TaxID=1069815 RepID=A0ABD3VS04_SINWO
MFSFFTSCVVFFLYYNIYYFERLEIQQGHLVASTLLIFTSYKHTHTPPTHTHTRPFGYDNARKHSKYPLIGKNVICNLHLFFSDAKRREQAALFGKHQPPKKRRKSRTAFTNQQIYELEKRFLYQKYLTPADRDEIAQTLGLTNAQVITWFQNRRAKLKRDLEELKNDVTATKRLLTSPEMSDNEHEQDVSSPLQECPNCPRDSSTPKTPSSHSTSDSCEERSHSPSNTDDSGNKSAEET